MNLGADTTITYIDTLLLDAGNPGSAFLWSTGDTTQTIKAYYTGNPTTNFWVEVTANSCTGSDEILVTFIDPVSIQVRNHTLQIRIIPNPNQGEFTLEITAEKPGVASFRILDPTGKLIAEQEKLYLNEKTSTEISLPGLHEGMFFLKLQKDGNLFVKKFLILN